METGSVGDALFVVKLQTGFVWDAAILHAWLNARNALVKGHLEVRWAQLILVSQMKYMEELPASCTCIKLLWNVRPRVLPNM
jgi:hypothetical protein